MRTHLPIASSLAALALGACDGKALSVGAGPADGGSTVAWNGYIENHTFPSGSDVITLNLTTAPDGTVTGTAEFGTVPLYAPPTNPNVGYPPWEEDAGQQQPYGVPLPYDPEGFLFTVRDGTLDGSRLRFSVDPDEIWSAWCALQTPYLVSAVAGEDGASLYTYSCLPPSAGDSSPCKVESECQAFGECADEDGGLATVDCAKLALCAPQDSPCACDAGSCSEAVDPSNDETFDLQVTATTMDGNLGGGNGTPIDVHFDRAN